LAHGRLDVIDFLAAGVIHSRNKKYDPASSGNTIFHCGFDIIHLIPLESKVVNENGRYIL
jgi:hypothetical protein